MSSSTSPSALAATIPDEPRWIDLRGLLLSGRCDLWVAADPEVGFIAASWDFPFAALYGDPGAELTARAVSESRAAFSGPYPKTDWQLLASPDSRPLIATALPGWRRQGIVLHRWADPPAQASVPSGFVVRVLGDGHHETGLTFDHVPETTARELTLDRVSRLPMAVAITESLPVAFCYAAFTTGRLWDVAIDTLRPFRRRGLATACFGALAAHMAERGKAPAWGAMEDNEASLRLAGKLGFVRDASLDGWSPTSDEFSRIEAARTEPDLDGSEALL